MITKRRTRGAAAAAAVAWSLLTVFLLAVTAFTAAHGAYETGVIGREVRMVLTGCEQRPERGRAPMQCTGVPLEAVTGRDPSPEPVKVRHAGSPGQVVGVVRTAWGTHMATDRRPGARAAAVLATMVPLTAAVLCGCAAARRAASGRGRQGRT
ncbi:hypothetical protein PV341_34465 [Streptomyces sp. PA03-1a]|nr:hypothetical protein [Streptomyces sp. PA03-1a]MDX2815187.1 hypothetical protein [Streptomyces sp. PA03-5A]